MTYFYAPKYSRHKWNSYMPCATYRSLWKMWLMHWSWKFTRRVSSRGKYNRIKWRKHSKRYRRCNPLCHYYLSPNELRVWGRFDR